MRRTDILQQLDQLMKPFGPRLRDDLRITESSSLQIATSIADEVAAIPEEERRTLLDMDPESPVSFDDRHEILGSFQMFMEKLTQSPTELHPAVRNCAWVVQNYICFVYLGDALFNKLRKLAGTGTNAKKCAKFLTDGRVRYFRNAFAHGNWSRKADGTGIVFWSRKGSDKECAMEKFEVSNDELNFWQALARAVSYAAYLSVDRDA